MPRKGYRHLDFYLNTNKIYVKNDMILYFKKDNRGNSIKLGRDEFQGSWESEE